MQIFRMDYWDGNQYMGMGEKDFSWQKMWSQNRNICFKVVGLEYILFMKKSNKESFFYLFREGFMKFFLIQVLWEENYIVNVFEIYFKNLWCVVFIKV